MDKFEIEANKMTPRVILDKENGVFCIEGSSMPENPNALYRPVMDWFKSYFQNPNNKTVLEFKIQYFNTSSSKIFLELLELMESENSKGNEVFVKWHYAQDDEEMKEAGEELLELVSLPFSLVSEDKN